MIDPACLPPGVILREMKFFEDEHCPYSLQFKFATPKGDCYVTVMYELGQNIVTMWPDLQAQLVVWINDKATNK